MSSVDGDHFPIHLDAMRVLIRMMIRNPSLELNNLPDMPDINDMLPGMLNLAASDATDPISISASARTIASRVTWNPFYQLLAEGPTSSVRSLIIDRCPNTGDQPDKTNWIWEKTPELDRGIPANDKRHSMGWDCVFVGKLYNKMRVKKDLSEELVNRFLKYADVLDASLKQISQTLQTAEASNLIAQQAPARRSGARA